MEIAALFRPHVEIEDGLVASIDMPTNIVLLPRAGQSGAVHRQGAEPALADVRPSASSSSSRGGWPCSGSCSSARSAGPCRTRASRGCTCRCSDARLLPEMEQLRRAPQRLRRAWLVHQLPDDPGPTAGLEMVSLVAEIPGYLQGTNPLSIEAVTRRLAKILNCRWIWIPLRAASTEWELQVSSVVEQNEELAETVRKLEEAYDNELLDLDTEPD